MKITLSKKNDFYKIIKYNLYMNNNKNINKLIIITHRNFIKKLFNINCNNLDIITNINYNDNNLYFNKWIKILIKLNILF